MFVRADRLDRRADGDRTLKPDGDHRQQGVVGTCEPVPHPFVALTSQLILRRRYLKALTDAFDESGEMRLPQQTALIHVIHCSAYAFHHDLTWGQGPLSW